jgi:hypothetical protein
LHVEFIMGDYNLAMLDRDRVIRVVDIRDDVQLGMASMKSIAPFAWSRQGDMVVSSDSDRNLIVSRVRYGATLKSGNYKQSWPAEPRVRPNADMGTLWRTMGDANAQVADAAIGELCRARDESVAFIEARLAIETNDTGRTDALIADLSSNEFAVRQRAASELEQIGGFAEKQLRAAIEQTTSEQARASCREIVRRMQILPIRSERERRWIRAAEVLERIASGKAIHVLRTMARGLPTSRLRAEATASLIVLNAYDGIAYKE